jgi:hypothetical protein
LGKRGLYEHEGVLVRRPSQTIREYLRCPTVFSTLRERRLRWLQTMIHFSEDNIPLFAVLCSPLNETPQLGDNGVPMSAANPWIKQWYRDLQAACVLSASWRESFCRRGFWAITDPQFAKLKLNKLRSYVQVTSSNRENLADDEMQFRCNITGQDNSSCARVFPTKQALVTHQRKRHSIINHFLAIVVCNQCPWCREVFSTRASARVHASRRQATGNCPARTRNPRSLFNKLAIPRCLECPLCSERAESLDKLYEHMFGCLETVTRTSSSSSCSSSSGSSSLSSSSSASSSSFSSNSSGSESD